MPKRWPLHPVPFAGEALSSWLRRLAAVYNFTSHDLLVHGLGLEPLSEWQLDIEPPDELIDPLATRTGIATERIRRMTLKSLLSDQSSKTKPGTALFKGYAQKYSVLLPPKLSSGKDVDSDWLPWISKARFMEPWACPRCLDGRGRQHIKLQWKLALTACCPEHEVFLMPMEYIGIIDLRPSKPKQRPVPESLLRLDAATERALRGDPVELANVYVPASIWFQLLRSILNELNTSATDAGDARPLLTEIWRRCNLRTRVGSSPRYAFEDLRPDPQVKFLEAAAMAVDLVATRARRAPGRDTGLLSGMRPLTGEEVRAEHRERIRLKMTEAIEEARRSRKAARRLRSLMLTSTAPLERIVLIDEILAGVGIVV